MSAAGARHLGRAAFQKESGRRELGGAILRLHLWTAAVCARSLVRDSAKSSHRTKLASLLLLIGERLLSVEREAHDRVPFEGLHITQHLGDVQT